MSWKDDLRVSADEAMRNAAEDVLAPAKKLLGELEKAGLTISLNATADGLLVKPAPSETQTEAIRANGRWHHLSESEQIRPRTRRTRGRLRCVRRV